MAKKNQPIPRSFEQALAELESILSEIESGEVGLEQSLQRYERGMFLLQHCREVLQQAEEKIELLSKNQEGRLQTQPLDSTETTDTLESDDQADEGL